MGAAAYNRGSRALAEQIASDYAANHPIIRGGEPLCWEDERARLTAGVLHASAESARLKREVEDLSAKLAEEKRKSQRSHEWMLTFLRRSEALLEQHRWAWGVIRAYVSPAQVQEYRSEEPEPMPTPTATSATA